METTRQQEKISQWWALENLKTLFPDVNKANIAGVVELLQKFATTRPVEIFPSLTLKEMRLMLRKGNQLKNTFIAVDGNTQIEGTADSGRAIAPKQFILAIELSEENQDGKTKYPHIELFTKYNKGRMRALIVKKVGYVPPRWKFFKKKHAS